MHDCEGFIMFWHTCIHCFQQVNRCFFLLLYDKVGAILLSSIMLSSSYDSKQVFRPQILLLIFLEDTTEFLWIIFAEIGSDKSTQAYSKLIHEFKDLQIKIHTLLIQLKCIQINLQKDISWVYESYEIISNSFSF